MLKVFPKFLRLRGGLDETSLRKEWQEGLSEDFKEVEALIQQFRSYTSAVAAAIQADPSGWYVNTLYYEKGLVAYHHIPSVSGQLYVNIWKVMDPRNHQDRVAARLVVLDMFKWGMERIDQIEKEVAELKAQLRVQ